MKLSWLLFVFLLLSTLSYTQQPVQTLGSGLTNTADASWTSGTTLNTAVTFLTNTSNYTSVYVQLNQGTTLTGGIVTFEESVDNTTFIPMQGVAIGTTAIVGPTYTLTASTNVGFLFPVNAPYFRVRLSTAIIGSGTVVVQHSTQSLPQAALLAGTETLAAGSNTIGGVTQASPPWEISPTLSVNSLTNPFFHQITDGTNGIGAMTNFGTTPGAVKALGVNASLFIGTTLVSSSNPFPISATGAANTKTNEIFANITDHTNSLTAALSALGTAPTGTEVMAMNAVNLPSTAAGTALTSKAVTTLTSGTAGVTVKASAGNAFGMSITSGATSGCWMEFINSAGAGTLGTAVIFSIALPSAGVVNIPPGMFPLGAFSTGIAVGAATTNGGATACGTASSITVFYE